MKRGRANGKYGRWQRAIRGELAGLCARLDVAEAEAVAAERARLETAIAAIDALIGQAEGSELRSAAVAGLGVLRELVAGTVFEFEEPHPVRPLGMVTGYVENEPHPSPPLVREGTVTGRIL